MNEAYINHMMSCKACYGPANRLCEKGREFKIQSDTEYKIQVDAEYVMSLPKVEQRRRQMQILKEAHPDLYERTKEKVKELFEERKAQVAA